MAIARLKYQLQSIFKKKAPCFATKRRKFSQDGRPPWSGKKMNQPVKRDHYGMK